MLIEAHEAIGKSLKLFFCSEEIITHCAAVATLSIGISEGCAEASENVLEPVVDGVVASVLFVFWCSAKHLVDDVDRWAAVETKSLPGSEIDCEDGASWL